jgi:hypothetical protein
MYLLKRLAFSSRERKKCLLWCNFEPYCVVFPWSGAFCVVMFQIKSETYIHIYLIRSRLKYASVVLINLTYNKLRNIQKL